MVVKGLIKASVLNLTCCQVSYLFYLQTVEKEKGKTVTDQEIKKNVGD